MAGGADVCVLKNNNQKNRKLMKELMKRFACLMAVALACCTMTACGGDDDDDDDDFNVVKEMLIGTWNVNYHYYVFNADGSGEIDEVNTNGEIYDRSFFTWKFDPKTNILVMSLEEGVTWNNEDKWLISKIYQKYMVVCRWDYGTEEYFDSEVYYRVE
jgi:hypothetical protein